MKGEILGDMLVELNNKYPSIGEARGVGLMWGLEIVDRDGAPDVAKANAIIERAFSDQHLILRGSRYGFGNVVKVRPSLTVTEEELAQIVNRLDAVLKSVG
ncbi:Diaminobutyrate--2-oxoglutarate aminotransferase [compost metagenome]